ncbi:MAG TPA: S46 family peptidase [Caulobacteraceae bacterium]
MNRLRVLAATLSLAAGPALAAEGFWPLDSIPFEAVREATGVTLDKPLLKHLQASTFKLTTGCSGSLVSDDGLALTNNHCVLECARALSDASNDYMRDGFRTAARSEERSCSGMAAEVLVDIRDITTRVQAQPVADRPKVLAAAEKETCANLTGYRCYGISFFRGGQYKVYRYRRYDDVRLVFSPEFAATFFGGDPDNFNFPRHSFDAAFLRLYDDGKPAKTPQHLAWTDRAPVEGEAAFLVGNPGSTERLLTVSQLETLRDVALPVDQLQRAELRGRLLQFASQGEEQARQAAHAIYRLENSYKVHEGRRLALGDQRFMDAKRAEEAELRAKVAADPKLTVEIGDPWADLAKVQTAYAERYLAWRQLEAEPASTSRLFAYARTLVRAAQERAKPSAGRLTEFVDSRLVVERGKLLAERPVEPAIEQMALEHWLLKTREALGPSAPPVRAILGKESPEGLSRRLIEGTKLADPAERKRLWDGGLAGIQASDDPLIRFVLATDSFARGERELWRREVNDPTEAAAERIARARFAVLGDSVYPDATFSPRLSFGKVEGWTWRGPPVKPFTTFGELYGRATGVDPYALSPSWIAAQSRFKPATVFNYVTTNDVIGGASGSPVVDAKGEVIGTAFDGNIHSLGGSYGYDRLLNRTVVVSTAAITEALDKVYDRQALLKELTGR